jgi:hypothetical protein
MIAYGRDFRAAQLAKAVSVVGAAASPLLLKALRRGPQAAFEFSARVLELCNELREDDPIPAVPLREICGSAESSREVWLDLGILSPEMPPGELAVLCSLVRNLEPRTIVEIGTARGWTTRHLARNSPLAARIFTVDLPPGLADASRYSDPQLVRAAVQRPCDFESEPKITQILHDSATVEWKKLLDRPVDFALVDGSHLYEHVRAGTEALAGVLAPSALILWHDYSTVEVRRGVRKYLLELHRSGLPIRRIASLHFGVCHWGETKSSAHPAGQSNQQQPFLMREGAACAR